MGVLQWPAHASQPEHALFSLLGTYYGGDGRSTFGLPDLRGTAPMQWGQGAGLSYDPGETGGGPTVTLLQTEVPSHPHALQASARPANLDTPPPQNALGRSTPAFVYKQPAGAAAPRPLAAGIMGAPIGGGQPHNNMMPFQALNFCIALPGIYPPRT